MKIETYLNRKLGFVKLLPLSNLYDEVGASTLQEKALLNHIIESEVGKVKPLMIAKSTYISIVSSFFDAQDGL